MLSATAALLQLQVTACIAAPGMFPCHLPACETVELKHHSGFGQLFKALSLASCWCCLSACQVQEKVFLLYVCAVDGGYILIVSR